MTTHDGDREMVRAAGEAAGNWKRFESFGWARAFDLGDADQWAIYYTHHRDSGLLDQSNDRVIAGAMAPYTEGDDPDVVFERHSHFAVGWIDGFSVRVLRDGRPTEAFRAYRRLAEKLDEYPVLDEEDYSRSEHEATLDNIVDAAWRLKRGYELPEGWECEVCSWLWEHRPRAVEDRDDRGGYPEEADLVASFIALGFRQAA
jgi:hypothetical protein